jgi:peptidoglycan/xylan/chitin deacetylase (PgdA/CDA1 family)
MPPRAASRVKDRGGRIHFLAVGQTMEQEDVGWIRAIAEAGHPIGNHTYDHVNVKAKQPEEIQFRFRRAPWLIAGKEPAAVIAENIRMASAALKDRIGVDAAGFRTPGGFHDGLEDRPDVQELLLGLGFPWVSSRYPAHESGEPGKPPGEEVFASIVAAQAKAQPFAYPSGLIEVPMSPISDVTAFRSARWDIDAFLEATRRSVSWAIENRATFDFLAHPSCLVVADPKFRAIDLICELVRKAGDRATLADLGAIATRASKVARAKP